MQCAKYVAERLLPQPQPSRFRAPCRLQVHLLPEHCAKSHCNAIGGCDDLVVIGMDPIDLCCTREQPQVDQILAELFEPLFRPLDQGLERLGVEVRYGFRMQIEDDDGDEVLRAFDMFQRGQHCIADEANARDNLDQAAPAQ